MKKYLYLCLVALLTTVAFGLTSCSNDDEPSGKSVVGTWQSTDYPFNMTQYLQFAADGSYTEVNVDGDDGEVDVITGTWKQNGDKVTVINEAFGLNIPFTATVKSVSGSKLVLDIDLLTVNYKKVSDSTIDKYLE